MSGVKPITSYFKVLTKDQLELSDLLDTQSSRNYRTLSLQTAITNSTLSTKVYDAYVGLTQADDLPALENGVDDDVDEPVIDDDVEPVAIASPEDKDWRKPCSSRMSYAFMIFNFWKK